MVEPQSIPVKDIKPEYETRLVVIAQGTLVHDEDISEKRITDMKNYEKQGWKWGKYNDINSTPTIDYLLSVFRKDLKIKDKPGPQFGFESVQAMATYLNPRQKVKYIIINVITKADFKKALEMKGILLIYQGHAFNEGLLFDNYEESGFIVDEKGEKTLKNDLHYGEDGNDAYGFFRMGYPYISQPVWRIEKKNMTVHPVPVESGEPPNEKGHPYSRSPDCRKPCIPIKLSPSIQKNICTCHRSPSNTYYGFKTADGKEITESLLVQGNWKGTTSHPFDLGGADMKCKVLCIFSCISRALYWDLIRRPEYKGWKKPAPPTEKFAYFTTSNCWITVTHYWLECLLKYNQVSKGKSWWDSLEYARKKANDKLKMEAREFAKSHKNLKIW
jgi:hypothetical protein